jgi:hypothetical protein
MIFLKQKMPVVKRKISLYTSSLVQDRGDSRNNYPD